jgi:potassium efflux system protein
MYNRECPRRAVAACAVRDDVAGQTISLGTWFRNMPYQKPFIALIVLLLSLQTAFAQTGSDRSDDKATTLSPEDVQSRIEQLEQAPAEDKATAEALSHYRTALSRIQATEDNLETGEEYKKAIDTAPDEIKQIRKQLDSLPTEIDPNAPLPRKLRKKSPEQLAEELPSIEAKVSDLQTQLSDLESQLLAEKARPDQTRSELTAAKNRLGEVQANLKKTAQTKETPQVATASRESLNTAVKELTSRIKMLELERLSRSVRVELLQAKRDLAERELASVQATVTTINDKLGRHREATLEQVEADAREAEQAAEHKHPLVRREASSNARFSELLTKTNQEREEASARYDETRRRLSQIERNFERIRTQLRIAGLDRSLGQTMLEQRSKLPDTRTIEQLAKHLARRATEVRLRQFEIEEQLRQLADRQLAVEEIIASASEQDPSLLPAETDLKDVKADLLTILDARVEVLENLNEIYTRLLKTLGDLELVHGQLIDQADQYRELIVANLWLIPSGHTLNLAWFGDLGKSLVWLVSPPTWTKPLAKLGQDLVDRPIVSTIILVLCAGLFWARRRLHARLKRLANDVGRVTRDRFSLTAHAILITILLAVPVPVTLYYGGTILGIDASSTHVAAMGQAMIATSAFVFFLTLYYQLCAPYGLGPTHFRWPRQVTDSLRSNLRWLIPIFPACFFIATLTFWEGDEQYRSTVGRLAFTVAMVAGAWFFWRVFEPRRGGIGSYLGRDESVHRRRLRYLWSYLLIGLPLVLAGLALGGYLYTAAQFTHLISGTVRVIVVTLLGYSLVHRWLLIVEKRMAFARAHTERLKQLEAAATKEAAGAVGETVPEVTQLEEFDYREISHQAKWMLKLLTGILIIGGLWWVWGDFAPALGLLDNLTLWERTTTGPDGAVIDPVTLKEAALSIGILVIALAAARSLPGLLEVSVLQPFGLAQGNRYAISTILRYTLITAGMFGLLYPLGIGWGDVQWLVAAMGVGLGFGLKEIFANFVSGLIVLFERPVRVGDAVTIGNVSGIISRIQIRATTIRDWDNKELIIPNQTLVIDPIVNWTLSDTTTRVIVPIGIAYGSDTEKAHKVMLDVVENNPLVLSDPAPTVFFLGFGDSSLNFEVRAFVEDRLQRLTLTHQLHMALDQALRKNGIEIPFPQRDLHLRSVDPDIRLEP